MSAKVLNFGIMCEIICDISRLRMQCFPNEISKIFNIFEPKLKFNIGRTPQDQSPIDDYMVFLSEVKTLAQG